MKQNNKADRPSPRSAEPILYFAYGSNMNPQRMELRCPGAIDLGHAVLFNYRLAERLYADVDLAAGCRVHGVLYWLTPRHLAILDRYEGYPQVYRRGWLEVEWREYRYKAVTYEMTQAAKSARRRNPFPEEYRKICSDGAVYHQIPDAFNPTRRKGK